MIQRYAMTDVGSPASDRMADTEASTQDSETGSDSQQGKSFRNLPCHMKADFLDLQIHSS